MGTNDAEERLDEIDDVGTRGVKFNIHHKLYPNELDEYIVNVFGSIDWTLDDDSTSCAGTIRGQIIRVDRIHEKGEEIFDVCDAHSQTLHEYSCALFDSKTKELKETIDRQFGGIIGRDVLVIDKIEILPQHRGKGIGLAAMWRFLDL